MKDWRKVKHNRLAAWILFIKACGPGTDSFGKESEHSINIYRCHEDYDE